MHVLIIGGTRNMGHLLAFALLEAGHRVSIFNRGLSADELPPAVTRLRGDRTAPAGIQPALDAGDYDAVVDMVLYDGGQARKTIAQLRGRCGHYVFISTGQVYLVRAGLKRPCAESDYAGPLLAEPRRDSYDHAEWLYGIGKREVEDALAQARATEGFPATSLRLPMVNGERDYLLRLYNYFLRVHDGGPLLIPDAPQLALRHVYAGDVVRALLLLLERGPGTEAALNLSQEETIALPALLDMLAGIMGARPPEQVSIRRSSLEANGFLPDCSPFSERWMSEMDNSLGKAALGLKYTSLPDYLTRIVRHYETQPPLQPASYKRRHSERKLAARHALP